MKKWQRPKEEQRAAQQTRLLWCPPKCEFCNQPIWGRRQNNVYRVVTKYSVFAVCKRCYERDRSERVARELMKD